MRSSLLARMSPRSGLRKASDMWDSSVEYPFPAREGSSRWVMICSPARYRLTKRTRQPADSVPYVAVRHGIAALGVYDTGTKSLLHVRHRLEARLLAEQQRQRTDRSWRPRQPSDRRGPCPVQVPASRPGRTGRLERCLICARTFLPRMLKAQASIASVILRSHLIWLPRRLCRSGIEPSRPGNGKRVQAPPSCHLAHTAFDDHEFTS